jgi:hypothetical protein
MSGGDFPTKDIAQHAQCDERIAGVVAFAEIPDAGAGMREKPAERVSQAFPGEVQKSFFGPATSESRGIRGAHS